MEKISSTKLANWLVAAILVLVPFHAFLTVWASTLLGHFAILRLWDDLLLGILIVIVASWIVANKQLRSSLFKNLLFRVILVYVCLTLLLAVVSLIRNEVTVKAVFYGTLVNTRFLLWFVAVWIVSMRSGWLYKLWPKLVLWPLLLVSVFASLQFFALPSNFLSHFGYNKDTTYVPIITINQDTATIRAQSFLRGANPLGAYLVLGLGLLAALTVSYKRRSYELLIASFAFLALAVSFSRSAWLGSFITIGIAIWLVLKKRRQKQVFAAAIAAFLLVAVSAFLLLHNNHSVQNAVLHVNDSSTAEATSNTGHLDSLREGIKDLEKQPLGHGPGTAGQASWYNSPHPIRNTEDYFLEVGLEVGWIGLAIFGAIIFLTARELYRHSHDPLSRGLFAALIGLLVVNLLTYGWVDDTLGFLFWGLAGIALGRRNSKSVKNT